MHESIKLFGGANFPSKSTLQYPLIHTDIHSIVKKRVIFAKFCFLFESTPNSLLQ